MYGAERKRNTPARSPETEAPEEPFPDAPVYDDSAVVPPRPPAVYSFETELNAEAKNRVNNIRITAQELSGTVIQPGEEFSFNGTVGKRTTEKGYLVAPIIVQGKKEKGVGGGVCQVSTTLYNAALEAGLTVTEHHEHTKDVSYVEDGQDAAVSYGSADLKILNTGGRAFEIYCEVLEDAVRVTLTEV